MTEADVIGRHATVTRVLEALDDTPLARRTMARQGARHVWKGIVEGAHVRNDRCKCKPPAKPGDLTGICLNGGWITLVTFDMVPGVRATTTIEFD